MLQEQITALEKRATQAEAILKGVTSGKKDSKPPSASTGAVDDKITISKLQQLQKLIEEDKAEADAVRAQRDELKDENEKLRSSVSKAEYRIQHLLRTIEALEKK